MLRALWGAERVTNVLLLSPRLSPGGALTQGVVSYILTGVMTCTGLEAQASPRHSGRLVHSSDLVLLLKLQGSCRVAGTETKTEGQ